MKNILSICFFVISVLLSGCIYYSPGNWENNNNNNNNNIPNYGNNWDKIPSLRDVIDNNKYDGDTIYLSNYPGITDYNATIDKKLTINGSGVDLKKNQKIPEITVEKSGVILTGINNAKVTASKKLTTGTLKISNSNLDSLTIYGGGSNSIHLDKGCIVDKMIVDKKRKESNDNQNTTEPFQYVRIALDETVTINKMTIQSSVMLDAGQSVVTSKQLPKVIIKELEAVPEDGDQDLGKISIAVSANLSFDYQTNDYARIPFGDKNLSSSKMEIFTIKASYSSSITTEFFKNAAERFIGNITETGKTIYDSFIENVCGTTICADNDHYEEIENLVESVNITFHYNNGTDETSDVISIAKGKILDVSEQGISNPGYSFKGWSTNANQSDIIKPGTYITADSNMEYWFVWEKDFNEVYVNPNSNVWTYSDKIANISTAWAGGPASPEFCVLFINNTMTNIFHTMDFFEGDKIPLGETFYQIQQNPIYLNITFPTDLGNGFWPTQYDGVCAKIDGDNYTLYVDKTKVIKPQLKAFSQQYKNNQPEPYAQQMTEDNTVDLSNYYPVVIALSANNTSDAYLGNMWNGMIHRMKASKESYPSANDLPETVTFDIRFTGTINISAFNGDEFPNEEYSVELLVKNVRYYKGAKVPFNFMADSDGQTTETADQGKTLEATLFTDIIGKSWEAEEAPPVYQNTYKYAKKCNIGLDTNIWLGFDSTNDEFDIQTWREYINDGVWEENPTPITNNLSFADMTYITGTMTAWNHVPMTKEGSDYTYTFSTTTFDTTQDSRCEFHFTPGDWNSFKAVYPSNHEGTFELEEPITLHLEESETRNNEHLYTLEENKVYKIVYVVADGGASATAMLNLIGDSAMPSTGTTSTTIMQETEQSYYYKIIFDSNGGTGSMSDQTAEVSISNPEYRFTLTANSFSRDGWYFIGWNMDSQATTPLYQDGAELTINDSDNKSIVLYAVWYQPLICYSDGSYDTTIDTVKTPVGIAIETDSSGKPTKMIHLKQSENGLAWCTQEANAYSLYLETSETDGSGNWNVIKQTLENNSDLTDDTTITGRYPAFEYANSLTEYDGGWYIPAVEELSRLHYLIIAINDTLSLLSNIGMEVNLLFDSEYYWSSTRTTTEGAAIVHLIDSEIDGGFLGCLADTREQPHYIRAIHSF